MKTLHYFYCFMFVMTLGLNAQSPSITSWLQNTTETGSYYATGNSTAIDNGALVNCQQVEYSDDWVYVHTQGVPAYPTGPFQDGNPSNAEAQDLIYKLPLAPTENTGTLMETLPGKNGVFINGVSIYDYRDGVAWNPDTNALCGGPGNPPCPGGPTAEMDWNRDAVPAEKVGFDCSKGHPAMGDYHHHQNPSAFKLDLEVVSEICNLYDADGLYMIDEDTHSPLIGFAYDGYPIYGAYGYKNADGTGGIERIKSSYQLQNITTRTNGPDVDETYFLGYFREDYEYVSHTEEDYLDEHNGRFCVTPEYPEGTYAYFATVDENWNSAYPYLIGPTFYGEVVGELVDAVEEATTVYLGVEDVQINNAKITVLPNPAQDLVAIQMHDVVNSSYKVELFDANGKLVKSTQLNPGSTIAYFSLETVYNGVYFIKMTDGKNQFMEKLIVKK